MGFKTQLRFAQNAANAIDSLPKLKDRKVSYDLGLLGSSFSKHAREFQRQINKVIAGYDYTTKDGIVAVPSHKTFEFQNEQEAMLDVEIELPRGPWKLEQIQVADASKGEIEPWVYKALIEAGVITEGE